MFEVFQAVATGVFFTIAALIVLCFLFALAGAKDVIVHRINIKYDLTLAIGLDQQSALNDLADEVTQDFMRDTDQTLHMVNPNY